MTESSTGTTSSSTESAPTHEPVELTHEKAEQAARILEASRSFGISAEQYMLPAQQQIRMLDPEGNLVPEDQQGTGPGHEYPIPEDDILLKAYEGLVAGRRVNDQNYALVRQGRLAVYPSSHGQEACQVGAALCLAEDDWLFPTYRDTVAAIARGVDPLDVMVSFRGDWHCGYDPHKYKVAPQSTPLTTQLLHAVGVAHAAKLRGEDTVVVAMCGDGATSEGDFHEALNFAAVFEVPVVFFVQNNGYAISVPLSHQSAAPSLAHKAIGYGMAGEQVDGNDMVAVLATLRRAVHLARENSMPLLLEAVTYRMQAHTNADDDTRYRTADEVEHWKRTDPLVRLRKFLTSKGVLDDDAESRIAESSEEIAASLRQAMTADPAENPLELFDHVYSAPTAQLSEQRAQLDDELRRSTTEEGAN